MAVNSDGTLIASASSRGHIIKIFSSDGGDLVQELKRGNSKADIQNLVFHPVRHLLACTSSNQSVQLFELSKAVEKCIEMRQYGFDNKDLQKTAEAKNTKSTFGFMKVLNKYWDSDLCLSKIKLDDPNKVVAFDSKKNKLAIITYDRTIYFVEVPSEQCRYIERADCRFY